MTDNYTINPSIKLSPIDTFAIILQSKLNSFNHFVKERFITRKAQEADSGKVSSHKTSQAFSNNFII